MEWIKGFFIPLIEIVFFGALFGFICYYIIKAVWNVWSKQLKFIWKYKIRRKSYPEKTVEWIMNCVDKGIGWYSAKKLLMVNMMNNKDIDETLWIYDQVIEQLKGGLKNNGREFKRSNIKDESKTKFPSTSTE